MEDTNNVLKKEKVRLKEVTIGSVNVKALYPSLEEETSAQIVKEEIEMSDVNINVNEDELSRYLPVCLSKEVIRNEGLEDVVYREKDVKEGDEGKIKVTDKILTGGSKFRERYVEKFDSPKRKPTEAEARRMTALAVKIAIKEVMRNNVYVFNKKTRRQKEGGPIGVELTGGVSRVVMGRWDRLFKMMMKEAKMIMWMFQRYVDDMNQVVMTERNKKMVNGKIVMKNEEEVENEKEVPDDEVTMKLVREIADEVMEMIKTEEDFPTKHRGGLLPILDLQVRMQGRKEDPEMAEISFQFYKKPMAPDRTILFNSAMPMSMKRTTATQEVLRRLLNCSRSLGQEVRAKHLTDYMQVLTNSGYSERFRQEVLRSGEEAYRRLLKKEEEGERRLYRRRTDNEGERWKAKRMKKGNWQGRYSSVIFVPYTKDSKLKKEMQVLEERMRVGGRENHHMKIIERAGPTMAGSLVRKDPFGRKDCEDKQCFQCTTMKEKPKISCRVNSVGYVLRCLLIHNDGVDVEYVGESGQNALTRGKKHIKDFKSGSKSVQEGSAMFKHMTSCHPKELREGKKDPREFFRMEVVRRYKTACDRQIDEGNNMKITKANVINSRREWHQATMSRTVVVRGGAEILPNLTE
jgi:hypothetical protein